MYCSAMLPLATDAQNARLRTRTLRMALWLAGRAASPGCMHVSRLAPAKSQQQIMCTTVNSTGYVKPVRRIQPFKLPMMMLSVNHATMAGIADASVTAGAMRSPRRGSGCQRQGSQVR